MSAYVITMKFYLFLFALSPFKECSKGLKTTFFYLLIYHIKNGSLKTVHVGKKKNNIYLKEPELWHM